MNISIGEESLEKSFYGEQALADAKAEEKKEQVAIELGDSDGSFHSHASFNASDVSSEEVKVEEIMPAAADLPKE